MWTFIQSTGELLHDGEHKGFGYSGSGPGKNNAEMQDIRNVGPIPRGTYAIGEPHDSKSHGPYVLALEPSPDNEMFGRSCFLIHGDSIEHPGTASEGCIILSRFVREQIGTSGDDLLAVVKSVVPVPAGVDFDAQTGG